MATLSIGIDVSLTAGGEPKGFDIAKTFATAGKQSHDRQINVAGGSSATYQTLWDASVDLPATFAAGFIVPDGDGDRTSDVEFDVRITNNSVTSVWRCSSSRPLVLGKSAQATGAITKIEVANKAGTTATTDDVLVRLLLFL